MKNFTRIAALLLSIAIIFGLTGCDSPVTENIPTYYTVTFNSNGGSAVEKQIVASGSKATMPAIPTKAASPEATFTFAGWYSDAALTTAFDFETAITADLTLYAKWTATAIVQPTPEATYTVTITSGITNGTVSASKTSGIKAGETITLTATPANGYKLGSLSVKNGDTDITVTNNTFTMPAANVTVSATFEALPPNTYSVTIESTTNGTVVADKTSGIAAGETVTLAITPATKYELDSLSVTALSSNQISGSGNTKTFTMPAQNVTVTITFKAIPFKSATEAKEVGDIVFNDGTAMSYTTFASLSSETQEAIKTSAIALIFYKGTSSSDALGAKTLGVGLKHAQKAWCTMEANAYNTKIDTIYCAPSGSAGSLTFGDNADKNGSDNFIQIAAKLGEGTANDDTGTESKYPAFYFAINYSSTATNLGTTYAGNWYLPSLAELFQIYACRADATNGFDIDAASAALGGSQFEINSYVSSSQYISDFATGVHTLSFNSGDYNYVSKKATHKYICAIRAFDTNLYSVSIGSTANGSVNADKRSGIVAGETVTLTATPSDGYKLDSISATSNGNPVSLNGDGNTRTFTMPAANVNVTALFVITKIGTKKLPNEVGDIVFNDGTALPASEYETREMTDREKENAIAVVADVYEGQAMAVGLKQEYLPICSNTSQGYTNTAAFSHDGDAGQTRQEICYGENDYITDYSQANYPAIYWAQNYKGFNNLKSINNDWFIPTKQELLYVYASKESIIAAINKIGSQYADPFIKQDEDEPYYSTVTNSSNSSSIYQVNLNNGSTAGQYKDTYSPVLVIRYFSCGD